MLQTTAFWIGANTGKAKAGCGYFADSLIRALAQIDSENEYLLYPTFGDVYWDADWPVSTCEISAINFRRGLGHRSFATAKNFWSQPPDDFEAQLGSPDIMSIRFMTWHMLSTRNGLQKITALAVSMVFLMPACMRPI
jgi:hypothetical protein